MKKWRAVLMVVSVPLVVAAAYWLTRPVMAWAYGIAPIEINGTTLYVKFHDCGAVCTGQMYITRNPKRCAREDRDNDYLASDSNDTLDYAITDNHLVIADDGWEPPKNPWLPIKFVSTYGHASDSYSLQYIMFGNHIERVAKTGIHVDVRPCRVFPDGLFDGTWHEWAD